MLEAAREARTFVKGYARSDLDGNRMLVLALLKSIEIIGEAASRVTSEARAACPSIPWAAIVGMRNRLVHGYFDVDLDIVWATVDQELPDLIRELEHFLR